MPDTDWAPCHSYCSHGGVCELNAGHDGLHDSRYCTWTDGEAVPKDQADAILAGKPGGIEVLDLIDIFEGLLGVDDA